MEFSFSKTQHAIWRRREDFERKKKMVGQRCPGCEISQGNLGGGAHTRMSRMSRGTESCSVRRKGLVLPLSLFIWYLWLGNFKSAPAQRILQQRGTKTLPHSCIKRFCIVLGFRLPEKCHTPLWSLVHSEQHTGIRFSSSWELACLGFVISFSQWHTILVYLQMMLQLAA